MGGKIRETGEGRREKGKSNGRVSLRDGDSKKKERGYIMKKLRLALLLVALHWVLLKAVWMGNKFPDLDWYKGKK